MAFDTPPTVPNELGMAVELGRDGVFAVLHRGGPSLGIGDRSERGGAMRRRLLDDDGLFEVGVRLGVLRAAPEHESDCPAARSVLVRPVSPRHMSSLARMAGSLREVVAGACRSYASDTCGRS
ncbi:hypothetical protein AB0J52_00845 [Spirillospora sp. NPDC049652]